MRDIPKKARIFGQQSIQIRRAVEEIFGVRVTDVRTINVRGKTRRFRRGIGKKPNWKKAIVTLRDGDIIDVFEGV